MFSLRRFLKSQDADATSVTCNSVSYKVSSEEAKLDSAVVSSVHQSNEQSSTKVNNCSVSSVSAANTFSRSKDARASDTLVHYYKRIKVEGNLSESPNFDTLIEGGNASSGDPSASRGK